LKEAAGSRTGVYTGSFADDYKLMTLRDPEAIPKHAVSGGSLTMLAARLSWFFDLKGPCVNLDTACSSSMIALDQACQALRNGECSMVSYFLFPLS
jgi:acyl transferase domain-containing protein